MTDAPASPARQAARWAFRESGRLTAWARMLPGYLIVGAQRCGTTSLQRALVQHPAVLSPVHRKGVHYFDMRYHKGGDWYRGHFPLRVPTRRAPASGDAVITGEASPYYMFHPLAGERIARDLPGVRLIVLLRDPVDRAYSAHTHEFARGYETEPFERALELEPDRLAGEVTRMRAEPGYLSTTHQHNAYLARGRYIEQLEALTGLVGRERIHVVDSGELFTDPARVFAGLWTFLGVPPPGHRVRFEQHNARPRTPLPEALRDRLDAYFLPYDQRLAQWLGRTPSWRR